MKQLPKKSFFSAAIGTMLEYYDYALFALFLPIISPLFFPAASSYQSLIKGYFVLLISMLARPLGGLLFGYIGDLFGRQKALQGSIYGIAIATTIIGLTPSHMTIGVWAAIIVTISKSIQIFCFGGEYNGAGIYVVEHTKNQRNEAIVGSFLTATTLFGSLFASVMGILTTLHFMPSWSWRVAFILGGLFGVFGIIYRKNLLEVPNFKKANFKKQGLSNLIKDYKLQLLAGMFIGGFATVPFTTVLIFINPILMTKGFLSPQHLMILQTVLVIIAIITLILSGKIADKKSPEIVMRLGAVFLILFSYLLLKLIDSYSLFNIIFAQIILLIINEILLGPSNAYLKNAFPMQYRYRGASFSFCIGMSVFGGLTPVVESYIYQWTGTFSGIALWLIFIGIGTLVSITLEKR